MCGHSASSQGFVRTRVSGLCRATVLTSKAPKTPGPQLWPWPRYSLPVEKAGQRPVKENPWPTNAGAFVLPALHCSNRDFQLVLRLDQLPAGYVTPPRAGSRKAAPSTTWGFVLEPRDPPVCVSGHGDRGNTLDAMTCGGLLLHIAIPAGTQVTQPTSRDNLSIISCRQNSVAVKTIFTNDGGGWTGLPRQHLVLKTVTGQLQERCGPCATTPPSSSSSAPSPSAAGP